jgi:hypothetical protein
LANNGGPTFTMALGVGSPAISTTPLTPSNLDQRGFTRTNNDIGAYAPSPGLVVSHSGGVLQVTMNSSRTITDLHTAVSGGGSTLTITVVHDGGSLSLPSAPAGVTTNGSNTVTVDLLTFSTFAGINVVGSSSADTITIGTGGVDLSATTGGAANQSFTINTGSGADVVNLSNIIKTKGTGAVSADTAITITGSSGSPAVLNAGTGSIFLNGNALVSGSNNPLQVITSGSGSTTLTGLNTAEVQLSSGVVTMAHTATQTGGYRVSGGTLRGGSLAGRVGYIFAQSGTSTLAPGVDGPGMMHTNLLLLSSGCTLQIDLQGALATQYEHIEVCLSGRVQLSNAVLSLVPNYSPVAGTVFTIIDNVDPAAVIGTFCRPPRRRADHLGCYELSDFLRGRYGQRRHLDRPHGTLAQLDHSYRRQSHERDARRQRHRYRWRQPHRRRCRLCGHFGQ